MSNYPKSQQSSHQVSTLLMDRFNLILLNVCYYIVHRRIIIIITPPVIINTSVVLRLKYLTLKAFLKVFKKNYQKGFHSWGYFSYMENKLY